MKKKEKEHVADIKRLSEDLGKLRSAFELAQVSGFADKFGTRTTPDMAEV
jgi:hypothetical protein